MKVAHKQLFTYPWLMLLIILTVIIVMLEQSMAEKVFSSYDSRIIHEKELKEFEFSEHLIEFPSVQQAVDCGALPCNFCMGQNASHSGNQQTLISDTIINPQIEDPENTQTKTDAVNQPYIHQQEPQQQKREKTISDAIIIIRQ